MAVIEMSVINLGGDTKITWDSDKPVEVDNARRMFNELKQQGYTAHVVSGKKGTKTGQTMSEFDPEAEGLVMVPVMTAG